MDDNVRAQSGGAVNDDLITGLRPGTFAPTGEYGDLSFAGMS